MYVIVNHFLNKEIFWGTWKECFIECSRRNYDVVHIEDHRIYIYRK